MKKALTLALIALFSLTVFAQNPEIDPTESEYEKVVPSDEVLAALDEWNIKGYKRFHHSTFKRKVKVAVVENEIYIQGLSTIVLPESWLKGTIAEDGTVTFPRFTYAGSYTYGTKEYDVFWCHMVWDDNYNLASYEEIKGTYDFMTETFTFTTQVDMVKVTTDYSNSEDSSEGCAEGTIIMHGELPDDVAETGDPVETLPFRSEFGKYEDFARFGVIDVDFDSQTWTHFPKRGAYYDGQWEQNNSDDYLISPSIYFEAGKLYNVSIKTIASSYSTSEDLEIVLGKEPKKSALTQVIVEPFILAYNDYIPVEYAGTFSVAETGYYHIAVHAICKNAASRITIQEMVVEYAPDPKGPQAVSDLKVTPGHHGQKRATIQFTTPEYAIDGSALTEELDVNIYHNDVLWKTIKAYPGMKKIIFDDGLSDFGSGDVRFTIICNSGNLLGKKVDAIAYIGFEKPLPPTNTGVTVYDDHLTFTWDEVSLIGQNDGAVDPAQVSYQVWKMNVIPTFGPGMYTLDKPVTEMLTGVTSCDVPWDPNSGFQNFYSFVIIAYNEAGDSWDHYHGHAEAYLGTPYPIPANEDFESDYDKYKWFAEGDIALWVTDVNALGTYSLEMKSYYDNNITGGLLSGKFALDGAENATLSVNLCSTIDNQPLTVYVETKNESIPLNTVTLSKEWKTYKWSISDFKDEPYVRFHFIADFPEKGSLYFDDFNLADSYSDNLVTSIQSISASESDKIYTISGIRVSEARNAGVYIINGKKIVKN